MMASRTCIVRASRGLGASTLGSLRSAPRPQWQNRVVAFNLQQKARSFSVMSALNAKKYTEDHEWIEEAEKDVFTLGISKYAAEALGDVVYIELPSVSIEVGAGEAIGAVESVKSASDILTPISGEIVEVNSALEEKPGHINKDPEGSGWIAKIKVEGGFEAASGGEVKLLSEQEYQDFIGSQKEE